MAKEIISPPNVFDTRKRYGYSQAIKAGNTIYLAGQVAWDEDGNVVGIGDFEAQTRQVYENMKRILEAAGASMTDIVWMTILCKDVREFPKGAAAFKEYFGRYYPTGTCIQIASLAEPELLVEIQAIAVVEN